MVDHQAFLRSFNARNYIFRIGEVSKMTGVSPRQLRYWEQKGYIHSERSEKMASRVFDHDNFMTVKLIKYYLDSDNTLGNAVQKAREHLQTVKTVHQFLIKISPSLVKADGETLIDLGYFNAEHTKKLYGRLDPDGNPQYEIKQVTE
ncbi:MerR family transcriptional regulator [Fructilactobacillus florum]|uniref:MerR family transcriptional regulator n=1 Tax=Fructilactobacillus florum TaxID=640331 RepID=UPI00068B28B9|nr:MerR family transcriptional regulator [Fructilactobacillus florum]